MKWLLGLLSQKEAEAPGGHTQQVCHVDSISPMCSPSTLSAERVTPGTYDEAWGHHVGMGIYRGSCHLQEKLSFVVIYQTQWGPAPMEKATLSQEVDPGKGRGGRWETPGPAVATPPRGPTQLLTQSCRGEGNGRKQNMN